MSETTRESSQYDYQFYLEQQRNRSLSKVELDLSGKTVYLLSKIARFLRPNADTRVLCVGCRNRYELDQFESFGCKNIIGIDLHSTDPRILVMDMHSLDFPDGTFDLVYSSHSLEHALDPQKACAEFRRVVKPNGLIVIEVPIGFHQQDIESLSSVKVRNSKAEVLSVPVDNRGLLADIWDFQTPESVFALVQPGKKVWSEKGTSLDNPNQEVLRVIARIDKSQQSSAGIAPAVVSTHAQPPADVQSQPTGPIFSIVHPTRLSEAELAPNCHDVAYSQRRYFVDEFYQRRVKEIAKGAQIIDLGGKRMNKRGQFNIDRHGFNVRYANLDASTQPDFLCDIAAVPVPTGSADAVVLAEVVEHLRDPDSVFKEAARILKPGGILLATAPFLYRIHPDPVDIGRYLPQWWGEHLAHAGFTSIEIEPQGLYFSSMADLCRDWILAMQEQQTLPAGMREFASLMVQSFREFALRAESRPDTQKNPFYQSLATGFGVRAVKR